MPIEIDEVVKIPRSVSSSILLALNSGRITGDDLVEILKEEGVFNIIRLILRYAIPGVTGIGGDIHRDGSRIIFTVDGVGIIDDILPAEGRIIIDLEDSVMIVDLTVKFEEEEKRNEEFILSI